MCALTPLLEHIGAIAFGNAHFGTGVGTIYLNNVECTGTETGILQCSSSSAASCTYGHSEDAGVRCQGTLLGIY